MTDDDAVIVAATRSAIGRAGKGGLAQVRPDDLLETIVGAALAAVAALDPAELEDVVVGVGEQTREHGFNIARRVAVALGYDELPGTTVNRFCASSVQALRMAYHGIKAGEGSAYVAAGVECVSRYGDLAQAGAGRAEVRNPRFASAEARTAEQRPIWMDPRADGDLPDVYIGMGDTAENVASAFGVSRADQDAFALLSQQRAVAARDAGFFAAEITPVPTGAGQFTVDDGPRAGTTAAGLAALQPAFRPGGTVTPGNCCPLNDGAAALVVMSGRRAAELGIDPLARVLSTAVTGVSPEIMGMGPVAATTVALKRAGLGIGDVDLVEINEAFAAQVLACQRELGIDTDRLNVHGGAIALGHPFGMTGARVMTTLLNGLRATDATIGVETMCVGGGQGMAVVVERLS